MLDGVEPLSQVIVVGRARNRLAATPSFIAVDERTAPVTFELRGTAKAVQSVRLVASTPGILVRLESIGKARCRVNLDLREVSAQQNVFRVRFGYEDGGRAHVRDVFGSIENTSAPVWSVNPYIARMPKDGGRTRITVRLCGLAADLSPGVALPSNVVGVSGSVLFSAQGETTIEVSIDWTESGPARIARLIPPAEAQVAGPLIIRLWRGRNSESK